MADQIRQPVQKRSIETKRKIIEAAYDIFAEVGYFETNTVKIAKRAGVSTGIVYGYFKNKRDIMLDVIDVYINRVYGPIIEGFDEFNGDMTLDKAIRELLDAVVKAHFDNAGIHEVVNTLTHNDELVMARFDELEEDVNKRIVDRLKGAGYNFPDINERVHVGMNIVQSYAHEAVFANHEGVDKSAMHEIVTKILLSLFDDEIK